MGKPFSQQKKGHCDLTLRIHETLWHFYSDLNSICYTEKKGGVEGIGLKVTIVYFIFRQKNVPNTYLVIISKSPYFKYFFEAITSVNIFFIANKRVLRYFCKQNIWRNFSLTRERFNLQPTLYSWNLSFMELDYQFVDWLISINKIILIYYFSFNNKVSSSAGVIVHLFLSKKMLVYLEKYSEA